MPLELNFEPQSPRYSPLLVLGWFDTNSATCGPFLAILVPFLGHAVELQGNKRLIVTGQP